MNPANKTILGVAVNRFTLKRGRHCDVYYNMKHHIEYQWRVFPNVDFWIEYAVRKFNENEIAISFFFELSYSNEFYPSYLDNDEILELLRQADINDLDFDKWTEEQYAHLRLIL